MINRFMKRSRVLLLLYHDFYNLNNIIRCIMMLSHNGKAQAERMDTPGAQPSQPKLKWRLAPLAIVGGTALAAYFAGFNLATMAAAIFPQGTWLFSALTAVGTLGSVGASAAMVAGGLLSVAVIVLSAVLIVSMVSRNSESEDQQKTVLEPQPQPEPEPEPQLEPQPDPRQSVQSGQSVRRATTPADQAPVSNASDDSATTATSTAAGTAASLARVDTSQVILSTPAGQANGDDGSQRDGATPTTPVAGDTLNRTQSTATQPVQDVSNASDDSATTATSTAAGTAAGQVVSDGENPHSPSATV